MGSIISVAFGGQNDSTSTIFYVMERKVEYYYLVVTIRKLGILGRSLKSLKKH